MSSIELSRRSVLSAIAGASLFGPALARAATIPAHNRTGTIQDVEHVVILMQENRSFDHYFGTMAGVRGFADPRPAVLPSGASVFEQPAPDGRVIRPFRFDVERSSFSVMSSLDHSWLTGHQAWNRGLYDGWIKTKSDLTMGYLERDDIPYHFALADTFTVGDAYFASLIGPTCPNRFYLMTGSVDGMRQGGGPIVDNDNITQIPNGQILGRGWTTYAERLQREGISWRAYRQGDDFSSDDDSDGGMNLLLAFEAFRNAKPGDPLYEFGVAPRRLEALKNDVLENRLPQVSWLFPPRIFCEHPNWPPLFGMEYIARVLDALTANPDVWSKTVLLVMYDENDGFFDHVPPPVPPLSADEGLSTVPVAGEVHLDGRPFGLGMRVPFIAISPWSRGGFVNSEVFDHTSVIRFLETRFGVHEPNITPWRRSVCGDLTSMFDFQRPNAARVPELARDAYIPLPDQKAFDRFKSLTSRLAAPSAPVDFVAPRVASDRRPTRPLAYDLAVDMVIERQRAKLSFHNLGSVGAAFTLRDAEQPLRPQRRYTVEAGKTLRDALLVGKPIDIRVDGANGFLRELWLDGEPASFDLSVRHDASAGRRDLRLRLANLQKTALQLRVTDGHGQHDAMIEIGPEETRDVDLDLTSTDGWYDLVLGAGSQRWRGCGHVENRQPSMTDPAIRREALRSHNDA
jgi:phospholipase C